MKREVFCSGAMRCAVAVGLAWVLAGCAVAQQTEADIRARLVKKPLYLRGQWNSDSLTFDDAGHLQGTAGRASLTLSGIDIGSVKLTSKGLVLTGQRVGLEFTKDVPRRVGLLVGDPTGGRSPEEMTIKVQTPADGDFAAALDAIFADGLADLDGPLPECWQQYAQKHWLPAAAAPAPASPAATVPHKVGGVVTAPRVLTQAEPTFSGAARALKYSGAVLVSLIVGQDGKPVQIRILHPVGLGLDERAVASVARYTFQPAMQDGAPVPVMLNIEVNFQIF